MWKILNLSLLAKPPDKHCVILCASTFFLRAKKICPTPVQGVGEKRKEGRHPLQCDAVYRPQGFVTLLLVPSVWLAAIQPGQV